MIVFQKMLLLPKEAFLVRPVYKRPFKAVRGEAKKKGQNTAQF